MPLESPASSLPFDHHLDFDPAGDFDAFLKSAPARWVVYLMCDAEDRPVQLLCVKNLRYSLKRRFSSDEAIGPSKRVNYREMIRKIHYRRVDSLFEADWMYFESARQIFPDSYRGMVGFRPAWFVHVNDQARFPRYIKTTDLAITTGELIGPVEDKHAAARLIELVEDCFDLCRYHQILLQAPRGQACAYKEMGKCPAPCDGSISMPQYRRLIEWSARVLVDPADYIREQTRRMQQAAAELRFETAAKIKQYIDLLSTLGKGPFRHVNRLGEFQFLSLQAGPKPGTAKLFLITPGRIQTIACLVTDKFSASEALRLALETAAVSAAPVDAVGAEIVGIVSHHLFAAKNAPGAFLPLGTVDEKKIARACAEVQKQRAPDESDDEGVTKELLVM